MSKSPAFQFYAENFLAGTADMSCEEVGAYIRLLCHQWHKGSVPSDEKRLMKLTGAKKSAVLEVKKKFNLVEGNLLNDRLEKSRAELEEYKLKKSKAGSKGNEVRWGRKDIANVSQCDESATNLRVANPIANDRSSSSSSSSSNNIYLSKDATSSFWVGLTQYFGKPSELLESEHKIWFDQKLYGTGLEREKVHKAFDDKFKADSFSTTQHFRNAAKLILDQLINQKNGNNKKFNNQPGGATQSIRSGQVKDFGKIEL